MEKNLTASVAALPHAPGVYIWKGADGGVLYVGKARDLRSRASSYLNPQGAQEPEKMARLMERVNGLEYMVTATEGEALVLEANLIKQHRPQFNVRLADDKYYPYVRVGAGDFPSVGVVRKMRRDGAQYMGPYGDTYALRRTLRFARTLFPVRDCKWQESRPRERPCLEHHTGRCLGPCALPVDPDEYARCLNGVLDVLSGKDSGVRRGLERRMQQLSEHMEFEQAAKVRDHLRDLARTRERQEADVGKDEDLDAVNFFHDGEDYQFYVLVVREGRLLRGEAFRLVGHLGPQEALASFLAQYYQRTSSVPPLVVVPEKPPEAGALADAASRRAGRAVAIQAPKRGRKARLLEMAERNARLAFYQPSGQRHDPLREAERGLRELRAQLGLAQPPRRIEGFDVSNLGGRDATASVVVFEDGRPAKQEYRRLRLQAGDGGDVAMMAEALVRRYGKHALPDLVLLDGGLPQLAAARQAAAVLGRDLPVAALAKEREELFLPGRAAPLRMAADSPARLLLQRVRDESHRFATAYHRLLRRERLSESLLDEVPGVGQVRKRALLRAFPDTAGLRAASMDEIARVPGVDRRTAERVYAYLRGGE